MVDLIYIDDKIPCENQRFDNENLIKRKTETSMESTKTLDISSESNFIGTVEDPQFNSTYSNFAKKHCNSI